MNAKLVERFLKQFLVNSEKAIDLGKNPAALCVEGPAGIGKTSIVKQVVNSAGYQFVRLNLGELEDLGSLVGYPVASYQVVKGSEEQWVPKELLETFIKTDFRYTGETRMTFANPSWVPNDLGSKGVLFLDDFNRALPLFMQATMTLIDERSYGGWKLPDGWILFLSSNPDGREYSVSSLDAAQRTRFLKIDMDGSVQDWAAWAEKAGMDNRVINFVLANEELFDPTSSKVISKENDMNFRLLTKYLDNIAGCTDFSTDSWYIYELAKSSCGDVFAAALTKFLTMGLDKLPLMDNLFKDKDGVQQLIGVTGDYKADRDKYNSLTSSILATRLINYGVYAKTWSQDLNTKMKTFILSNAFTNDQKMLIIRSILKHQDNGTLHRFIASSPEIIAMIKEK